MEVNVCELTRGGLRNPTHIPGLTYKNLLSRFEMENIFRGSLLPVSTLNMPVWVSSLAFLDPFFSYFPLTV